MAFDNIARCYLQADARDVSVHRLFAGAAVNQYRCANAARAQMGKIGTGT